MDTLGELKTLISIAIGLIALGGFFQAIAVIPFKIKHIGEKLTKHETKINALCEDRQNDRELLIKIGKDTEFLCREIEDIKRRLDRQ